MSTCCFVSCACCIVHTLAYSVSLLKSQYYDSITLSIILTMLVWVVLLQSQAYGVLRWRRRSPPWLVFNGSTPLFWVPSVWRAWSWMSCRSSTHDLYVLQSAVQVGLSDFLLHFYCWQEFLLCLWCRLNFLLAGVKCNGCPSCEMTAPNWILLAAMLCDATAFIASPFLVKGLIPFWVIQCLKYSSSFFKVTFTYIAFLDLPLDKVAYLSLWQWSPWVIVITCIFPRVVLKYCTWMNLLLIWFDK